MDPGKEELEALRAAVYLMHLQTGVRAAREQPLPLGMSLLLQVAAGEDSAVAAAALRLERSNDTVRQAAAFYLEHVVLTAEADAFRMLASARGASDTELRRNMALLLRWAHPDLDRDGTRAAFAGRVTRAWEALKTPERRLAYEEANPPRPVRRSSSSQTKARSGTRASSQGSGAPVKAGGKPAKISPARRMLSRALRFLVGARRTQR